MADFQQNFLASLHGGMDFGQRIKQQRDQNQLNQLASQAYGAAPEQRDSILSQTAAVDAGAAQGLEKQMAYSDERRNATMVNMARMLQGAPEQARAGIYSQMLPTLSRFIPSGLPQQYDAETSPVIMQAAKSLVDASMGATGAPTDVRSFQMMTQGLSADDQMKARRINLGLDGRASSSGFSQVKFAGADGRERIGVLNGKTGQIDLPDGTSFNPQTGAISATTGTPQGAPPAGTYDTPNGRVAIGEGLTPAQWQAVQADVANGGGSDIYQLPPQSVRRPAAGGAFVGRSPEEQAALTEQAKTGVQLRNLPTELDMRTEAAIRQTQGQEQAKQGVERAGVQATRTRDANDAMGLIAEARRLLPGATGGRLAASGDSVAGFFGSATEGAKANAALKTIAGQMTAKMPRMEGPQSDRDVQMYKEMAGDVANQNLPVDIRVAALNQIERLQSKYASTAPVRVQSTDDYSRLPPGALYTAPDGSQRRKR